MLKNALVVLFFLIVCFNQLNANELSESEMDQNILSSDFVKSLSDIDFNLTSTKPIISTESDSSDAKFDYYSINGGLGTSYGGYGVAFSFFRDEEDNFSEGYVSLGYASMFHAPVITLNIGFGYYWSLKTQDKGYESFFYLRGVIGIQGQAYEISSSGEKHDELVGIGLSGGYMYDFGDVYIFSDIGFGYLHVTDSINEEYGVSSKLIFMFNIGIGFWISKSDNDSEE